MSYVVSEHPRGFISGVEEEQAVLQALRNGKSLSYAGENIPRFEEEFARYIGVKYAITVANATVGLFVAAQALRLKCGDEVIMTPQTFRATGAGLLIKGCRIRFADIDASLNIDPDTIEPLINDKTRAIFVTHMHGNPVDMKRVLQIARKHGLKVVDDAAHAPGAMTDGSKVGSIGDLTVFSFHCLKNMSTAGEGGMITTQDDELARDCKALRTMGVAGEKVQRTDTRIGPYEKPTFYFNDHSGGAYDAYYAPGYEIGLNMRLSDVQAAFGRVQLTRLDHMNQMRSDIAARYDKALEPLEAFTRFQPRSQDRCVYHLYPVLLNTAVARRDRNEVIRFLQEERRIEMMIRYFPMHLSEYMQHAGYRLGDCPVCERVYFEQTLHLPISPNLTEQQIDWVVQSLEAANDFAMGRVPCESGR